MKILLCYDGGLLEPRLHRGILPARLRISAVCSLSTTKAGKESVCNFAKLLGCPIHDEIASEAAFSKLLEKEKPKGILATLSEQSAVPLVDILRCALEKGVNVCLPQPCLPFNTLDIVEVMKLYALADQTNAMLFATSRFCFSSAMYKVKSVIQGHDFGGVDNILFRTGWGPSVGRRETQLALLGSHAFHVVFSLIDDGLPQRITVLEDYQPKTKPPSYTISLQWESGIIATIFLTACRTWSVNYHNLEISGRSGAFMQSDFLQWELVREGNRHTSLVNDDDQSSLVDGSAERLELFGNPEMPIASENQIILHSFWLRDVILRTLRIGKNAMTLQNLKRGLRRERLVADEDKIRMHAQGGDFTKAIQLAKDHSYKGK